MTECHLCLGSPELVPAEWGRECWALLHPPVETVSPPIEELRRMVLRSVVPLGLLWAEKAVPVMLAPEPVPGAARMGRPRVLGRRAGILTRSSSADSPRAR